MITHALKPSEVLEQVRRLFTARGFHIPEITFQFVCRSGGRNAYGFWIAGAPRFGFVEMRGAYRIVSYRQIQTFERYQAAERYCYFCFMIAETL